MNDSDFDGDAPVVVAPVVVADDDFVADNSVDVLLAVAQAEPIGRAPQSTEGKLTLFWIVSAAAGLWSDVGRPSFVPLGADTGTNLITGCVLGTFKLVSNTDARSFSLGCDM